LARADIVKISVGAIGKPVEWWLQQLDALKE
jgi:hypothetical protein